MDTTESLFDAATWNDWVKDADSKIKDPRNRKNIYIRGQKVQPLPSLEMLENKVCVYAIWENDCIVYIGKSKKASDRLIDHITNDPQGTHHNEKVHIDQSVANNNSISISAAVVSELIYSSIEESLIVENKTLVPNGWNKRLG